MELFYPPTISFKSEKILQNKIGSPCILFHSKYKKSVLWDNWKASDFRFINGISEIILKKVWIEKVFVQINNFGDLGNRNDFNDVIENKRIFSKNLFWFLLPKYHFKIWGIYIFQIRTYDNFFIKIIKRMKHLIPLI